MHLHISQPTKTVLFAAIGFLVRLAALHTPVKELARHRVEVTTPITNWRRVLEAVYLSESGLDPYSGSTFHEYPISLEFYKFIIRYFDVDIFFSFVDVLTAIFLQQAIYYQLLLRNKPHDLASSLSFKTLLIYLLSPMTLLSCIGRSTAVFTNCLIAIIHLILPVETFRTLTCVLCAILACNNIHYSVLILPVFLCLEHCSAKRKEDKKIKNGEEKAPDYYYQDENFASSLLTSFMVCLTTIFILISTSYILMNRSWSFLDQTYMFALRIRDLTPNIGMFWYLFMEVYEHFTEFFTWVVQLNAFVHVIPISVYLKKDPLFGLYIMIVLTTIFQPYPSLSNVGLISSLFPQWSELRSRLNRGFVTGCTAITCLCLWPVFWHLWIVMGTANSNFYFGATLAFSLSLVLFLLDLLEARSKSIAREKLEVYKKNLREADTKPAHESEQQIK